MEIVNLSVKVRSRETGVGIGDVCFCLWAVLTFKTLAICCDIICLDICYHIDLAHIRTIR